MSKIGIEELTEIDGIIARNRIESNNICKLLDESDYTLTNNDSYADLFAFNRFYKNIVFMPKIGSYLRLHEYEKAYPNGKIYSLIDLKKNED